MSAMTMRQLVVVGLLNLFSGAVLLAADAPAKSAGPVIPEGLMLVDEDVWYQLADEPDRHFHAARVDYLVRDYPACARDLRKGVAVLKLAAARASGNDKEALQASILELETLAAEAGHGKVRQITTFDRIFSRAFYALSEHNFSMAKQHVHDEEPYEAGFHIRSATRDVERAMTWMGEGLSDEAGVTLESAEEVSVKLMQDGAKLFKDVILTLDALHAEINSLRALQKAAE